MLRRAFSLFVLLLCLAGQAATDIFMRVEGIPGDAQDERHRNEIVLTGYAFDFLQSTPPTAGGGGGAGRVTITPFTVTKVVDSASPRLALASASGERIRQVVIVVRQAGGPEQREFLRFTLNDVAVTGFSQQHGREETLPTETLQLSFAAIEMEFIPQRPDGSAGTPVRMRWDVRRNAPG